MRCPDIGYVTFSPRSRDAIENIRKVDKFSMALQRVTAGGVVVNIFAGNGALESLVCSRHDRFQNYGPGVSSYAADRT